MTGGAGFLGSHLVRQLRAKGVPQESVFIPRSREYDLRKRAVCDEVVEGKHVVIHLAGLTGTPAFHGAKPADIFRDNLLMGVHLMEAAREAGVEKFVNIGSATEYSDLAPTPYKEEDLWKGAPPPLHAPYSLAKKMLLVQGEAYWKQFGFAAVHLILANMYGPGDRIHDPFVIPALIGRILKAREGGESFVQMQGSGEERREFIYVEDAAQAVLLAVEGYDSSEPVNIGSGVDISIRDLALMIGKLLDYRGEFRWGARPPNLQLRRLLDVSRAERAFGFRARVPLEEGLEKTINWYLTVAKVSSNS